MLLLTAAEPWNPIMTSLKSSRALSLLISLIVPVGFFLIGLANINDYGETTDEKFDQHIGEFYYYNWKQDGLPGLEQRFRELQRNYGPFFDVIAVASHDYFHKKWQILESPVAAYHLPVIGASALCIFLVYIFTLRSWGPLAAFSASLSLALMPRFIGDSQNNLKDTPLAALFTITVLLFYLAITRRRFWLYPLAGMFWGLTYCIKINAILLAPVFGLWWLLARKPLELRFWPVFTGGLTALASAAGTIMLAWPYYRTGFFSRFAETYHIFKEHEWNELVLYLGHHYSGQEVPWHFPIVMIAVTTPLMYLLLTLIVPFFTLRRSFWNTGQKMLAYLCFLWMLVPIFVQAFSGAPLYDGVRHYLIIMPAMSMLVGAAVAAGARIAAACRPLLVQYSYCALIALYFTGLFLKNFALHPYQIVYFNSLTGGVKGAYGQFDLDYWGSSLKQAAEWINSNVEQGAIIWVPLWPHHFPADPGRFVVTGESGNYPDYRVVLIRGMMKTADPEHDYLTAGEAPVYTVKVEDTDILRIFKVRKWAMIPEETYLRSSAAVAPPNLRSGLELLVFKDTAFSEIESQKNVPGLFFDGSQYHDRPVGVEYLSMLRVDQTGLYCFHLSSDDQALFRLSGQLVIKNPSMKVSERRVSLEQGFHEFSLRYQNNGGPAYLELRWSRDNCNRLDGIPDSAFSYHARDNE